MLLISVHHLQLRQSIIVMDWKSELITSSDICHQFYFLYVLNKVILCMKIH